MTLEQAERLLANDDFKAFLQLLDSDSASMVEDLVYHTDAAEILRTQCKIITLRGVKARIQHVIDDINPPVAPASDLEAVSSS